MSASYSETETISTVHVEISNGTNNVFCIPYAILAMN